MKYVAYLHSQLHLNAFRAFLLVNDEPSSIREKASKKESSHVCVIHLKEEITGECLISEEDCRFTNATIVKDDIPTFSVIDKILNNIDRIIYYPVLKRAQKKTNNSAEVLYCIFRNTGYMIDAKELLRYQRESETKKIKIVFIEEGIGSYIRNAKRWKERGLEDLSGIHKQLVRIKKGITSLIGSDRIIRLFAKNGDLEYFCLFNKAPNGVLIPNEQVDKAFANVFYSRADDYDICVDYNNTIIISNQLIFDEQGLNDDLICFRKILFICKRLGIRLIIKPHPRDQHVERYNEFEVESKWKGISQEILFAKSEKKPLAVVGFFSTSLITGKLFYGIPAICLGKLVDISKLKGYDEDINNFMNVFNAVLNIPTNFEQLERMVVAAKNGELNN